MKRAIVLLTVLAVLAINPVVIALGISDGQSHTIDDDTYQYDDIYLDFYYEVIPGTHLNLIDGGVVDTLGANHLATIDIDGGTVNDGIRAGGDSIITIIDGLVIGYNEASTNSTVNILGGDISHFTLRANSNLSMFGGSLGSARSYTNSSITVFDGSVEGSLRAWEDSTITVNGGAVGGDLDVGNSGIINLNGTGFEVNGQALSFGDHLSDFVPLTEYIVDETINMWRTGTITGTLAGGSALNSTFHIYYFDTFEDTADIIVVPEPATLLLFGLGGLMLRRRK